MRKKPLFIAGATAVALGLGGLSVSAFADSSTSEIDEKLLQERVDALAEVSGTSVVAEVRSGDDAWSGAAGNRQIDGDDKAQADDHVRVGSITKSMVTTVAMQLAEDGDLDLDATVQELAPDLIPYDEPITVRQLLNHTSGVPDYFVDLYPSFASGSYEDIKTNRLEKYKPETIVATATERPLDFAPGDKYSYSNTGYFIVGLLVEQITGNEIEDEVTDRVVEPSGMDSTALPKTKTDIADPNTDAYFGSGKERWNTTEFSPTQLWAAGVTVSTAHDINAFYRELFTGDLISNDSLKQMRQFTDQSEGEYGLGLVQASVPEGCSGAPDGDVQGHSGGTLGHTSYALSTPDGKSQVTLSMGIDTQGLPKTEREKIGSALADLQVAGFCGDSASGKLKIQDDPLQLTK